MELNSLTWLLVTYVLFQMYTTLALIQSACSFGDATTWHPDQIHLLIFNTLHFTLSVGGVEVLCNLIQVLFLYTLKYISFRKNNYNLLRICVVG